jgi:thiol-disulfide isomerase/thioredoxin
MSPLADRSTRWTIAILVVVAALIAALVLAVRHSPSPPGGSWLASAPPSAGREHRDADTPAALAGPRQRAALPPCPTGTDDPGPAALRGVVVECAADGSVVDAARALNGRRVVLNLWAYWCGPCATELPAMAEYQRRVGSAVTVVSVHQDENETAALLRLAELGVRLPTFQDGRRRLAAALRVPNVMPATVVLRPDGSVAQTLPRAFASADEIAAAVGDPP